MFALNAKDLWFPPVPLLLAVVPQPTATVIWLLVLLLLAILTALPAKLHVLHVPLPPLVNASHPTMDITSVPLPPEPPRLLPELLVTPWRVFLDVCHALVTRKPCAPLGIPFTLRMPQELL